MIAKKLLAYMLSAAFIGGLIFHAYLYGEYGRTRPRNPQPEEGRTIPLNNHGTVVFLTKEENSLLTLIFAGSFACAIGAGLLGLRLKK